MKFNVTAQSFDRKTGAVSGKERVELIDTKTNLLFRRCRTESDVWATYQAFWNDLNPQSKDVVKVSCVEKMTYGYRAAVECVALGDEPGELDPEAMAGYASVHAVAAGFGKTTREVAEAVVRVRRKEQGR